MSDKPTLWQRLARHWGFALMLVIGAALLVLGHQSEGHTQPALEWLPVLLHHLGAILVTSSVIGVGFELWVHHQTIRGIAEAFTVKRDLSKLFSARERKLWMRNLLKAQIVSDPSLSDAVFTNIVEPLMKDLRYRSRFSYRIELQRSDDPAWHSVSLQPDKYALLKTECDFCQHFAKPITSANVSIFIQSTQELQEAFGQEACLYRDNLVFTETDAAAVKGRLQQLKDAGELVQIGGMVELALGTKTLAPAIDYLPERAQLIFTYAFTRMQSLDLKITIRARYLVQAGHYLVIFGEPTRNPKVTFCAAREYMDPRTAGVVHFLSGARTPPLVVNRQVDCVDVQFDHNPWTLPRSGLVFLWNRASDSES